MERKPLPIGVSDFKKVIEGGYYYVDKTLLIKEILDSKNEVILLPRPRRFGKTLNMQMLNYFFNKPLPLHGNLDITNFSESKNLFKDLNIWRQGDKYICEQGKYNVVFISFKDIKTREWNSTYEKLQSLLSECYTNYEFLLKDNTLNSLEKIKFKKIMNEKATKSEYEESLKNLVKYIHRYSNENVILLIDEYDMPIQSGYMNGFYTEIIDFFRNFLSSALKDNKYLKFSVLTGILRVAKESVFSGLNNLKVSTLLDEQYNKYFGFTVSEVDKIIAEYRLHVKMDEIKKWYNGYIFGNIAIYNPWSIINYVDENPEYAKTYWVNTSDNGLIKELLSKSSPEIKMDIEKLIDEREIVKYIDENIVYSEVSQNNDALWSFLLFSGYLKYTNKIKTEFKIMHVLKIPNNEIKSVYTRTFELFLNDSVTSDRIKKMLKALLVGDAEEFQNYLEDILMNSISYLDSAESFYHGFVLGLLVNLNNYQIKSNRESGYGRYDVMLIPNNKEDNAIIIEFKMVAKNGLESLSQAIEKAFRQIEDKQYESELKALDMGKIIIYAIAFEGKKCLVRKNKKV